MRYGRFVLVLTVLGFGLCCTAVGQTDDPTVAWQSLLGLVEAIRDAGYYDEVEDCAPWAILEGYPDDLEEYYLEIRYFDPDSGGGFHVMGPEVDGYLYYDKWERGRVFEWRGPYPFVLAEVLTPAGDLQQVLAIGNGTTRMAIWDEGDSTLTVWCDAICMVADWLLAHDLVQGIINVDIVTPTGILVGVGILMSWDDPSEIPLADPLANWKRILKDLLTGAIGTLINYL
jgi:hypothetical protein